MKVWRGLAISAVFVVIAVVVAWWLYPRLPAQVPVQWDFKGNVSNTMPRFWAAAWPALLVLGLAVLTWLLPVISPRKFEITPFAPIYGGLMLATQGAVLVIGVCVLLVGAGYALPMPTIVMLAIGVLFMVLGNYMGKLRRNFFIGIRTPWTLASDATWERTHRVGGWVFMLAGVALVILALAGAGPVALLVVIAAASVIVVVYSYVVYRRLAGRHEPDGEDP